VFIKYHVLPAALLLFQALPPRFQIPNLCTSSFSLRFIPFLKSARFRQICSLFTTRAPPLYRFHSAPLPCALISFHSLDVPLFTPPPCVWFSPSIFPETESPHHPLSILPVGIPLWSRSPFLKCMLSFFSFPPLPPIRPVLLLSLLFFDRMGSPICPSFEDLRHCFTNCLTLCDCRFFIRKELWNFFRFRAPNSFRHLTTSTLVCLSSASGGVAFFETRHAHLSCPLMPL